MKLLFIENRQKTYFWQEIAERLAARGHEIAWIVQNPRFAPRPGPGRRHVMPFPGRDAPPVADAHRAALARVASTDRRVIYHGTAPDHYPHYWAHIGRVIEAERPDHVIGEATLFHENLVVQRCKLEGIPYSWAGSSRYPPGRFCFFKDDTFEPRAGSGDVMPEAEAQDWVERIARREIVPDYILKRAQLPGLVRVRPGTVPATLAGYLAGERFNTPSPLRKWMLMRERHELRKRWEALAAAAAAPGRNPACTLVYPLQLQPESSLDVHATPFRDQCALIEALLANLPADVDIRVKPNPKSDLEISPRLIEIITANPRLRPLPHALTMNEALAGSHGVITINGTVALECLLAGSPVAVLSSYLHFFLPSLSSTPYPGLAAFAAAARAGTAPALSPEERRALVTTIVARSHKGTIADPVNFPPCVQPENLEAVTRAFEQMLAAQGARAAAPRRAVAV